MTFFFIKKAFFDGWDNFIGLVVLNLGYLLVLLAIYGGLELLAVSTLAGIFVLLIALALHSFYTGALSYQTKEFAWYSRPGFAYFKSSFKVIWRHALLHFGINALLITMIFFVIPFYIAYNTLFGFVVAVVVFWVTVVLALAMFYYYPLAIQMPEDKPFKSLKKGLMLVADNLWFSLFFAIYHIVNLIFTVIFATIMPGVAGIQLSRQVAVKLLIYKYDYLEENPDANRKKIPWDTLLFDEQEKVGTRTLRGMIFPWKE